MTLPVVLQKRKIPSPRSSASPIAKSGVLQEQLSNGQLQTYMLFLLSSKKGGSEIAYILQSMSNQKCLLLPARHFSG